MKKWPKVGRGEDLSSGQSGSSSRTWPGSTSVARMPKASVSYNMLSISPSTAYFVAQNGPRPGTPKDPLVLLNIR